MLPIEGDILTCLESFERRAVAIAFPHVPQALMRAEIRVFLANIEHPALPRPDFLAVLFAALALGIQHGLHDCCGGHWNPRIIESEAQRTDVFGPSRLFLVLLLTCQSLLLCRRSGWHRLPTDRRQRLWRL